MQDRRGNLIADVVLTTTQAGPPTQIEYTPGMVLDIDIDETQPDLIVHAPGNLPAHDDSEELWTLREHVVNEGKQINWEYWHAQKTWTALEAVCLAFAVCPIRYLKMERESTHWGKPFRKQIFFASRRLECKFDKPTSHIVLIQFMKDFGYPLHPALAAMLSTTEGDEK